MRAVWQDGLLAQYARMIWTHIVYKVEKANKQELILLIDWKVKLTCFSWINLLERIKLNRTVFLNRAMFGGCLMKRAMGSVNTDNF